jgi:hypothetical protein
VSLSRLIRFTSEQQWQRKAYLSGWPFFRWRLT